ncbi:MAG: low molecular weight protein-tyrosine-phosphatase [Chloroflexota bacterium]
MRVNVVFVCLGNICRSPMAEAIFQQMVNEAGLADKINIDSAGTGSWHVGETAHRGTRDILAKYEIPYDGRSRQVNKADMAPNTYVIAMDDSNMRDLKRQYGNHPRLYRLLDFAQETTERNVPDPYYTNNFEYVYELVSDGCEGLLNTIRDENDL